MQEKGYLFCYQFYYTFKNMKIIIDDIISLFAL